jgi:regulation of enolase protein 1 (concanavalin A-like superfamily)
MKRSYRLADSWLLLVGLCLVTTTALAGPTTFTSDDFNAKNLKRPLWTLIDPRGDAKLLAAGVGTGNATMSLSVPGGSDHDLWTTGDQVPKVMQSATNTDFTLEVKFNSGVSGATYQYYSAQGIIVKADDNNLIRFDFTTGNEDSTKVFAAAFIGGFASPSLKVNRNIGVYNIAPLWMRVTRVGSTWTVFYSTNGTSFTNAGSFTQALTVTQVGFFAGNAGGASARSVTAVLDYFFNNDAVISPEDPLTVPADALGPLVHNVHGAAGSNALQVTWSTEEASEGEVQYSEDLSFGSSYPVGGYTTDLAATVPNLIPSTAYNYRIVSRDAAANSYTSPTYTFTTTAQVLDAVSTSDDFNVSPLDATLWTATNPRGDATISVASNQLSIAVPGGITHDLWTDGNNVSRIMQPISNNDFQVIAKFNSGVPVNGSSYSIQGILVEADANNLIRFDFSNDGSNTRLLAIVFANGLSSPSVALDATVGAASAAPLYLRISRAGAQWLVDYSLNGTSWTSAGFFYHIMAVSKIGLFAGNTGASPAAFTMLADWFQAMLPARPLLKTPVNGATGIQLPVTMTWDTTSRASSYRLQVATDTNFTSIVFNDSTITTTSRQVTGLSNFTKYFWRVRGKGQYGIGQNSRISSFTSSPLPPSAPLLASPADNSVDVDTVTTVRWNTAAGAATYTLQLSKDQAFGSFVLNDSTIADTSKSLTGLQTNTKYYWRVSAKNAGGTSAFAATWNFTTKSGIPSVPALLAPANVAVNQPTTVTFRWSKPTPPATSYRLQVGTDATFNTGIVYNDSTLADTSKSVSSLLNNTTYYWRVNAKSPGGTSNFSGTFSFTTIVAAPAAPSLVSPTNNALDQNTSLRFTWTKPAFAATYRLQIATDQTFATGIVFNDSTLADSTTLAAGMLYNTTYYWRVNAKNIGGTGPYSTVYQFKTLTADPSIPVQLSPANGATNQATTVTVRWTRPSGASSFHLQLGTDPTFATGKIIDNPAAVDTFASASGLSFLTTYYWRVNADNVGGTSPYSPVWSFGVGIPTPAQVVLVSPASASLISADSVKLVWRKSSPGIDKYQLDLAVDTLFNFKTTDSTLTDSSKVLKSLINNQKYFWRLRARNPGGWGAFSEVRTFTIKVTSVTAQREMPTNFALEQNYPNPFNPSTRIDFALPKESRVLLEVYNLLGERIAVLADETRAAGFHSLQFNATALPSGLYLYRMTAGEQTFVRKMMLTK